VTRVEKIQVSGKEIISIDFTGCKSEQMIVIFNQAKVLVSKNENCLVLTNFERSYITASFLHHVEKEILEIKHLIKKDAFIGMSFPQRMILMAFKLFLGRREFLPFDSRQDAIAYLNKMRSGYLSWIIENESFNAFDLI